MIEVLNISKSYGSVEAVKDISFAVGPGQLFGLIGPDGAGKTSLIRILTTLALPDKGQARVMGMDVVSDFKKLRQNIGYMPGRFSLYEDLTVKENISLFASIYGTTLNENYDLVRDIYSQIEPFSSRKAGALSGGMKQKLALSCAMIHAPEVIFLDEPTTGVDPVSRKEFWEMLARLKERGITMLVSTPYMDEAARCDKVALMQDGEVLKVESPAGIIQDFRGDIFRIRGKEVHQYLHDVRKADPVEDAYLNGECLHVVTSGVDEKELREHIREVVVPELELDRVMPGIEDCFLRLMKREEYA